MHAARLATIPPRLPAALLLGGLLLSALLAACAASRPPSPAELADLRLEPPRSERQSLVYGYLDMSDAPTPLGWMEFRQIAQDAPPAFYQMRVREGVFYMEKFPPGVFVLGEFGGERYGRPLAYALPRNSPSVRLTIQEPGLHFVGAFKYRPTADPDSTGRRFVLDAIPTTRERDVLARILPFSRGTAWEARIEARMAQAR